MLPLSLSFLLVVGSYAMVKGELSEKLSIRVGLSVPSPHDAPKRVPQPLPSGLDGSVLNFDAKEETGRTAKIGPFEALAIVGNGWVQGMGWGFAVFSTWGVLRARAGPGKVLLATYALLFAAVLVRHATRMGYFSERHALPLVLAAVPWAAAGMLLCGRRVAGLLRWDEIRSRRAAYACLVLMVVAALSVQLWKPGHPSRWGHGAAGLWLKENARAGEKVLDTRGWARFVSESPGYDYWHVRQALSDGSLAYLVVGADELAAPSARAKTLRAILAFAGEPAASFPGRKGGKTADILVFRYRRPSSWEGLRP